VASEVSLVVTDLDGTLWDDRKNVSAETLSAIAELRARGIAVIAATARGPSSTFAAFKEIGLNMPAVLCNGAIGRLFDGTSFHEIAFSKSTVADVLEAFSHASLVPHIPINHPEYGAIVPINASSCQTFIDETFSAGLHVEPDAAMDFSVVAFRLIGLERERLEDLAVVFAARDDLHVFFAEDLLYGGWSLQIGPAEANKWSGVLAYCKYAGLDGNRVLGIGDDMNDVECLRRAHISIAMPHAVAAVTSVADHVLAPGQGWSEVLQYV
jgi:hydroxymethylpyrimidine pyrophosphatase-like HAD family hydrolase